MDDMMDRASFRAALNDELQRHITLDHPIVGELAAGERNSELLKALTLQGYQLTRYFLTYVEHLFFYCPIEKHKRRLLYNVYEEETGRLSKTKNHVELMHDFIRALGIDDDERDAAEPHPETSELIEYRLDAVKRPETRYHIGAAAV